MTQQRPPRMSFYVDDETKSSLDEVKQHYGITSPAAAVRRAIVEHAKQLKEPKSTKQAVTPTVTYSMRIF